MNTRYYAKGSERWRITVDRDPYADSPRYRDGNIGTILLPHGLGDNGMDIGSEAYQDIFETCWITPREVVEGMVSYYIGSYGYLEVDNNGNYHTTDDYHINVWNNEDEGDMLELFLLIVNNMELRDVTRICGDKLIYRYLSLECGSFDYLRTSETDTVNHYLGIIWTTTETAFDRLKCKTLNRETIVSFLDNEVSEYAAYLSGDVLAVNVEQLGEWGWETIDGSSGYVNEDEDDIFAEAEGMFYLNGYQVRR